MIAILARRTLVRLNSSLAAVIAAAPLATLPSICASASAQRDGSAGHADRANTALTRIILLGTNGGPRANPLRAEPANLLVVDGAPYLIDAGPGVSRQIAMAEFQHFAPGDGRIEPSRFTAGVMKYFPGPVIPAKNLLEYDLH